MPILHLLAGPNGSGKTTFITHVIGPTTHLPFVNADIIAASEWPDNPESHAYEASRMAANARADLMADHQSFITETVFSHESKLELVARARTSGYIVHLHVMMLPVEVTVRRVSERVEHDAGHRVPEEKIRTRYERLWSLIAEARRIADRTSFYDNSRADRPFRVVAEYQNGLLVGEAAWPRWAPTVLR